MSFVISWDIIVAARIKKKIWHIGGWRVMNNIYGPEIVAASPAQFWFYRLRSSSFHDAARSAKPIAENIDKIIKIVETMSETLD